MITVEMTEKESVAIPAEVDTDSQAVDKPKEDSTESSWKMRLERVPTPVWEAVILTPAILLIIGLFLLPTVYYALPAQQVANSKYMTGQSRDIHSHA